ncbi:hypothetical protein BJX68DRAFT_270943 [Aspergillus pseudodeflectus]|uniref:Transcription factor domain-containing protein n=1 Tax=Aspergillus pseudodeflectus TaxID=176178 RepID=A0ABR4JPM7_9EURO
MATSYILHYRTESLSVIDSELLKRLYWLCFAHQCTQALHGRPTLVFSEVDRLTLLQPREINDAELSPIRPGDEDWHGNWTSYIPGLNILSRLFMTWFQSQHGPHAHSYSRLQTSFELATAALDSIPAELRWRGGLSRPRRGNFGTDVQMVNLHITHIHIKAFLLDQIDRAAAVDGHGSSNNWVPTARQDLFTDMLAIVYQMPEEVLVANGYSLIAKLRDIGLALLSGKGVNSVEVVESLNRLLAKLERLDFPPALSDSSPSGMDNGV